MVLCRLFCGKGDVEMKFVVMRRGVSSLVCGMNFIVVVMRSLVSFGMVIVVFLLNVFWICFEVVVVLGWI